MPVLDEIMNANEQQRDEFNSAPPADWQAYRSVSRSAVVAVVLGGLGFGLGLLFPQMLVLCLIGVFAGIIGYRSVLKHPLEYTGSKLAIAGVLLSVVGLVVGIALHTYVYYTEIPDGDFQRISFYELQPLNPDLRQVELPPIVRDLNGQKIFVKGYVHPGVQGQGKVKHFILVPDMGTCCFGGTPKPTDMMEVRLETPQGISWSPTLRKLAGTFTVHPPEQVNKQFSPDPAAIVIYSLDATYVK